MSLIIPASVTGGNLIKVGAVTASDDATVDLAFTETDANTFLCKWSGVKPATDDSILYLRTAPDGSTFDATADYDFGLRYSVGGAITETDGAFSGENQIRLTNSGATLDDVGNAAGEGCCGELWVYHPADTDPTPYLKWNSVYRMGRATQAESRGYGRNLNTAVVNALRFFFDAGNIASGEFELWKLTNA